METWITKRILLDINKNEIDSYQFKSCTVDAMGQVLEETEFDPESNIMSKRIFRYFDTGEVAEYIEYDALDELLERHVYEKNELGEIDRIEFEYGSGQKSIKEFRYTDLGDADTAEIKNEDGEITGYEVYVLNEAGFVKAIIELDSDRREISRCEKEYSGTGLPSREKTFTAGILDKDETLEYDNKGNVVKKIVKNQKEKTEVVDIYQYDDRNNMVYNSSHQNGVLVFENRCAYDDKDQLILEEFFEIDYWENRVSRHERLLHGPEQ